jgi:hypothetical protein
LRLLETSLGMVNELIILVAVESCKGTQSYR